MLKRIRLQASLLVLGSFLVLGGLRLHGEVSSAEEAVPVDLGLLSLPGNGSLKASPVSWKSNGKEIDGVTLLINRQKGKRHELKIPINRIDAEAYNTLAFQAKFDRLPEGEKPPSFRVRVLDSKGGVAATGFNSFAKKQADGSYLFEWDMINMPDNDRGVDYSNVTGVGFEYTAKEDQGDEIITLGDVRFVAGRSKESGDPKLFTEWVGRIKNYHPDYSDSSHYLFPPKTGRIKQAIALTKDGQPLGEIVVEAAPNIVEQNATLELVHWIKEISGAALPVVSEPTSGEGVKIYIGRAFAEANFSKDIAALEGSDGFAIRTEGKSIYIFGAEAKGTMNGVFAFIENNSDIIWVRPHKDYGTVFTKRPSFEVVWADVLDRPVGKARGYLWNAGGPGDHFLWADRNRNNYNGNSPARSVQWGDRIEVGGGHNLQSFIPKDDPKYYPTIEGKKPDKLSIWKHQICLSVPNLVSDYAKNVIEFLQTKAPPEATVMNIKIEDNWGVCECEQCTAPMTLPTGEVIASTDPAFRSTQFYDYLNKVTEEVNKVFPEMKVQTYAYFFTAVPPKIALNSNVYILFCPYVRKDHRTPLYSPINRHWWERLKGFARLTKNVVIREYYGIGNEGRPLAEVVAADMQAYAAMDVKNIGGETSTDWRGYHWDGAIRGSGDFYDVNMMDTWLLGRIYWNPDADVEQLRKYFIRRTFREAAPMMEKFFGTIREDWFSKLRPPSTWGNLRNIVRSSVVATGKEEEMAGCLAKAAEMAKHPVSRVLIARVTERYTNALNAVKNPPKKGEPLRQQTKKGKTPQLAFEYGWKGSAGFAIYRTTIEVEGKFYSASHVIIDEKVGPRPEVRCGFEFDATDLQFKFVLIPKSPETAPLPSFSVRYSKGRKAFAPVSAYQPSSIAPGAMQFDWTPKGDGMDVNLSGGEFLELSFKRSELPPGGTEFYLVNLKVKDLLETGPSQDSDGGAEEVEGEAQ